MTCNKFNFDQFLTCHDKKSDVATAIYNFDSRDSNSYEIPVTCLWLFEIGDFLRRALSDTEVGIHEFTNLARKKTLCLEITIWGCFYNKACQQQNIHNSNNNNNNNNIVKTTTTHFLNLRCSKSLR